MDYILNLTIDNCFRNPFHWGTLKVTDTWKPRRFGVVFYYTDDPFSDKKILIIIFQFNTWSHTIMWKTQKPASKVL